MSNFSLDEIPRKQIFYVGVSALLISRETDCTLRDSHSFFPGGERGRRKEAPSLPSDP